MDSDAYLLSEYESFFWKCPSPSSGPSNFLFEAIDVDSDGSRTCSWEINVRPGLTMWKQFRAGQEELML